jgi:hypothetical protein
MPKKKKSEKDDKAKLVIRIESELRDRFVETCHDLDTSASREIRRFVRDFLASNGKPSEDT